MLIQTSAVVEAAVRVVLQVLSVAERTPAVGAVGAVVAVQFARTSFRSAVPVGTAVAAADAGPADELSSLQLGQEVWADAFVASGPYL